MRCLSKPFSTLVPLVFGLSFLPAGALVMVLTSGMGCLFLAGLPFVCVGAVAFAYLIVSYYRVFHCMAVGTPVEMQVVELVDDPAISINGYWACRLCCKGPDEELYYSGAIFAPCAEKYLDRTVMVYINGMDYYVKYK